MIQAPAVECGVTIVILGHTQRCGKSPEHVESKNGSRRAHCDFDTKARWPAVKGEEDPLSRYVHYIAPQNT